MLIVFPDSLRTYQEYITIQINDFLKRYILFPFLFPISELFGYNYEMPKRQN